MVEPKHRKLVVAGSKSVGKSSVVMQFAQQRFDASYNPTIEGTYKKDISLKKTRYSCDIIDTAGQDEFTLFQQRYALGVDGYVLVYSVTNRQSFELIRVINDKLLNATGNNSMPRIIVGNKSDLTDQRKVSREQGEALAKELGCPFVECSALKNEHVDAVFNTLLCKIEGIDAVHAASGAAADQQQCTIL